MILINKQPENLSFATSEYTSSKDIQDIFGDETGTSKLIVGEFVFSNVPFSINIETGQIRSLSASLKSLKDQQGMTKQERVGIAQKVTLKYNALQKSLYDSWLRNINKVVEVDLDNEVEVDYTEDGSASSLGKAVQGEYIIKKLNGKTTVFTHDEEETAYQPYDETVYDVTVELIKNIDYGEPLDWGDGGSDGDIGYVDYETIFDNFNPLDDVVDILAYINDNLIFEGYLDNITSTALKALGKERDLADTIMFRSFSDYEMDDGDETIVYNSSLTSLSKKALEHAGYGLVGNIDSCGLDADIIDTSVWDIVSRCCKDVGLYFYAEGGNIYVSKATTNVGGSWGEPTTILDDELLYRVNGLNFSDYSLASDYADGLGLSTDDIEEVVKKIVISTNTSFKGSKKFDSIIINANFRSMFDTYMPINDIKIKCYNKVLIAGEGLDYSIMESVPTNVAVAEDTSFECIVDVAVDENFYDISASETKYDFIPSTMPDTETKNFNSYWGSLDIKVDQELATNSTELYIKENEYFPSAFEQNAEFDYFISKTWRRGYTDAFDGNMYFHIYETGDIDEIAMFEVYISDIKLPPEDLYDGYRRWGTGDKVLSHSFCYKQSIGSISGLNKVALHLLDLRNAQLKELTFVCKGVIDVRPGEYVTYKGKNFYISSVNFKVDKNQVITTEIVGNEYVSSMPMTEFEDLWVRP